MVDILVHLPLCARSDRWRHDARNAAVPSRGGPGCPGRFFYTCGRVRMARVGQASLRGSGFGMDAQGDPCRMPAPSRDPLEASAIPSAVVESARGSFGGVRRPAMSPARSTRPIGPGPMEPSARPADRRDDVVGSIWHTRSRGMDDAGAIRPRPGRVVGRGAGEERGGEPAATRRGDRPGAASPVRRRGRSDRPGQRSGFEILDRR